MSGSEVSSVYSREAGGKKGEGSSAGVLLYNNLLQSDYAQDAAAVPIRSKKRWIKDVFTQAAVYQGNDELIGGPFIICVYSERDKLNSLLVDKLGVMHFAKVDISAKSQYFPAIENLVPKDATSNVKKCIAVTLLQRFSKLNEKQIDSIAPKGLKYDFDPPYAGELASKCKLVKFATPSNMGKSLLSLGLLQQKHIQTTLLDVVYENNEEIIDLNNRLVYFLGEQLEQLFDPLSEYSPEQTEYTYKPPEVDSARDSDSQLTKAICNELLQIQTNFTLNLVEFLQNFLITLRVRTLNEEIQGLSTVKLNRLFPPTIDEVTRINCIFLDSLKSAFPYGAFEILKACSITIPYFYKAYTRHEAATKNFSKDIKLFLQNFHKDIPQRETYTEMKIETIIKGPQEKLLKLKLIVDRLWESTEWDKDERPQAEQYYNNIKDIIHSFGKLESPMSSYNTRVFTPSGKILTELAKGWPVELQYKWLKRRVVGVFDVISTNTEGNRNLLVIFSDYVVFLNIEDAESYYTLDGSNKPLISDILMNSLINEAPLPAKIPKLKVINYAYIADVSVSIFDTDMLLITSLNMTHHFSTTCQPVSKSASVSAIAELITKATILEKDTAFHLFRAAQDDFTIYSTAHEMEAYANEKIKSQFAMFLNIEPSITLLRSNNLHMAIFASLVDSKNKDSEVLFRIMDYDGVLRSITVSQSQILPTILKELIAGLPLYYSSLHSPLKAALLILNTAYVHRAGHDNSRIPDTEIAEKLSPTSTNKANRTNKNSPSLTSTAYHEKQRSYGTITTFRSYASDLKEADVEKSLPRKKQQHPQNKIPSSVKSSKKSATRIQPEISRKQKGATKNKRKSLTNVLKSLFTSKKDNEELNKKITVRSQQKPKNQKNNSKTVQQKKKAMKEEDDKKKGTEPVLENKSSSEEVQNSRVSSVVRNPDFSKEDKNVQPDLSHEYEQNNTAGSEIKANTHNAKPKVASVTNEGDNNTLESEENSITLYRSKSIEKTDQVMYKQSERQSQVFNDDLFEDFNAKSEKEFPPTTTSTSTTTTDRDANTILSSVNAAETEEKRCNSTAIKKISKFSEKNGVTTKSDTDKATVKDQTREDTESDSTKSSSLKTKLNPPKNNTKSNMSALPAKQIEIFPSIPASPSKKSPIERSASFRELFEITRLVLDDSDAKYNWKRLPSEVSLKEHTMVKKAPHASPILEETEYKTEKLFNHSENDRATVQPYTNDNTEDNNEANTTAEFLNEIKDIADSALTKQKPNLPPAKMKNPEFKVVRTSPERIINKHRSSLLQDAELEKQLKSYRQQIYSNTQSSSKIELQGGVFYTPMDQPVRTFESSGNQVPVSGAVNKEEIIVTEGSKDAQKQEELLENLEFSSFNMSFDMTGDTTGDATNEMLESKRIQNENQLKQDITQNAIIFRLPSHMRSSNSSFSLGNQPKTLVGAAAIKDTLNEDDPIWVSPSKLKFYDTTAGTISLSTTKAAQFTDNSQLPRNISYSYLAEVIDHSDIPDSE